MADSSSPVRSILRFGVVEIDPARREVRCAGVPVPVEPKPFDLLLYLIEHRERVVRRDELLSALWPDVIVSEATLSSAMRRVRDVLGPERERIRVIRKVGYRFVDAAETHPDTTRTPVPQGDTGPLAATDRTDGLIGRDAELAKIDAAIAAGLGGRGGFVAIVGDAGAGKSRLLAEVCRRAEARGGEVRIGRCFEGHGGQVFWPWVQVFRSFAAARSEADLASALQGEAGDIARLTAAVAAADRDASPGDPEVQRARLLDSVVAVLRRAAATRPLLLAFDDLHWADNATVTLLRAVVDAAIDLPLVVLGTYRDREIDADRPLATLLSWLRQQRRHVEFALAGLGADDVAAILASLAGAPVDAAIAAEVFTATEGNPLFVREYWHDLAESRSVVTDGERWCWHEERPRLGVPATVSDIIERRLQRLGRETNQLLAIGAVIGREFGHEILGHVAAAPTDAVAEALEQAAQAGVVEELRGTVGTYRFTHALIRETLYGNMTGLRRAALHRAVGEALEALRPRGHEPQVVAELARHFLAATPTGGIGKAIDHALRVANAATRACAYDDAVRTLDQALRLSDERRDAVDAPGATRRCELQLELADALRRAGDGTAMRRAFEDAAARARALGAPRLLARAAIGVTGRWVHEDASAVRLLEESLATLPADEFALRALATARLARTLYLFPDSRQRRERLCAEARALAERSGDPHVLAEVLADSLEALFHSDSLTEQDALAAALQAAAVAADDARLRLQSGAWRIVNAMRYGRLREAELRLREVARLAGDLRQPRFLHQTAVFEAALLLARGRLAEAETRQQEALALGIPIDEAMARWQHWIQISHLRREQGRLAEFLGEGLAQTLPAETPAAHFFENSARWVAPHVFCEVGREADARASFAALMSEGLGSLPPENSRCTRIPALFSAGDACATIGDTTWAGPLYDALSPYREQWQVIGWGTVVFGSAHIILGALRSVQQRWSAAEEHFEEALAQHEREDAVCAQARALYQYARAVRRRGRKADLARADTLVARGLAIAEANDLRGVATRLRSLRDA